MGIVAFVVVRRGTGSADPAASPGSSTPPSAPGMCGDLPLTAARDLRGMTLTTVVNIDWPSQPGLDKQTVRREYLEWLDLAVAQRHNAIFVHIRPSGDAFWPSEYAPWS